MKKPIPFKRQMADAEKSIMDVFSNTNVLRSSTRDALMQLREQIDALIAGLDEDESNGVKDESLL